jgi:hypothetical protein
MTQEEENIKFNTIVEHFKSADKIIINTHEFNNRLFEFDSSSQSQEKLSFFTLDLYSNNNIVYISFPKNLVINRSTFDDKGTFFVVDKENGGKLTLIRALKFMPPPEFPYVPTA